jgi:hypothetical protein
MSLATIFALIQAAVVILNIQTVDSVATTVTSIIGCTTNSGYTASECETGSTLTIYGTGFVRDSTKISISFTGVTARSSSALPTFTITSVGSNNNGGCLTAEQIIGTLTIGDTVRGEFDMFVNQNVVADQCFDVKTSSGPRVSSKTPTITSLTGCTATGSTVGQSVICAPAQALTITGQYFTTISTDISITLETAQGLTIVPTCAVATPAPTITQIVCTATYDAYITHGVYRVYVSVVARKSVATTYTMYSLLPVINSLTGCDTIGSDQNVCFTATTLTFIGNYFTTTITDVSFSMVAKNSQSTSPFCHPVFANKTVVMCSLLYDSRSYGTYDIGVVIGTLSATKLLTVTKIYLQAIETSCAISAVSGVAVACDIQLYDQRNQAVTYADDTTLTVTATNSEQLTQSSIVKTVGGKQTITYTLFGDTRVTSIVITPGGLPTQTVGQQTQFNPQSYTRKMTVSSSTSFVHHVSFVSSDTSTQSVLLGNSVLIAIQAVNITNERVTTADATDCVPTIPDGGLTSILGTSSSRDAMAAGVQYANFFLSGVPRTVTVTFTCTHKTITLNPSTLSLVFNLLPGKQSKIDFVFGTTQTSVTDTVFQLDVNVMDRFNNVVLDASNVSLVVLPLTNFTLLSTGYQGGGKLYVRGSFNFSNAYTIYVNSSFNIIARVMFIAASGVPPAISNVTFGTNSTLTYLLINGTGFDLANIANNEVTLSLGNGGPPTCLARTSPTPTTIVCALTVPPGTWGFWNVTVRLATYNLSSATSKLNINTTVQIFNPLANITNISGSTCSWSNTWGWMCSEGSITIIGNNFATNTFSNNVLYFNATLFNRTLGLPTCTVTDVKNSSALVCTLVVPPGSSAIWAVFPMVGFVNATVTFPMYLRSSEPQVMKLSSPGCVSTDPVLLTACTQATTLTITGIYFNALNVTDNLVTFANGPRNPPYCNVTAVTSSTSLTCNFYVPPGSSGTWTPMVTTGGLLSLINNARMIVTNTPPLVTALASASCTATGSWLTNCASGTITVYGQGFDIVTTSVNTLTIAAMYTWQDISTVPTISGLSTGASGSFVTATLTVPAFAHGSYYVLIGVAGVSSVQNASFTVAQPVQTPVLTSITSSCKTTTVDGYKNCTEGRITIVGRFFDAIYSANNTVTMTPPITVISAYPSCIVDSSFLSSTLLVCTIQPLSGGVDDLFWQLTVTVNGKVSNGLKMMFDPPTPVITSISLATCSSLSTFKALATCTTGTLTIIGTNFHPTTLTKNFIEFAATTSPAPVSPVCDMLTSTTTMITCTFYAAIFSRATFTVRVWVGISRSLSTDFTIDASGDAPIMQSISFTPACTEANDATKSYKGCPSGLVTIMGLGFSAISINNAIEITGGSGPSPSCAIASSTFRQTICQFVVRPATQSTWQIAYNTMSTSRSAVSSLTVQYLAPFVTSIFSNPNCARVDSSITACGSGSTITFSGGNFIKEAPTRHVVAFSAQTPGSTPPTCTIPMTVTDNSIECSLVWNGLSVGVFTPSLVIYDIVTALPSVTISTIPPEKIEFAAGFTLSQAVRGNTLVATINVLNAAGVISTISDSFMTWTIEGTGVASTVSMTKGVATVSLVFSATSTDTTSVTFTAVVSKSKTLTSIKRDFTVSTSGSLSVRMTLDTPVESFSATTFKTEMAKVMNIPANQIDIVSFASGSTVVFWRALDTNGAVDVSSTTAFTTNYAQYSTALATTSLKPVGTPTLTQSVPPTPAPTFKKEAVAAWMWVLGALAVAVVAFGVTTYGIHRYLRHIAEKRAARKQGMPGSPIPYHV